MFNQVPLRANPGFDLAAITQTLRRTQAQFDDINRRIGAPRDRMDREVLDNLVEGYAYVDTLLRMRVELFALGSSQYVLELNRLVLCGSIRDRRQRYAAHLQATERHFYEARHGGINDLVEWVRGHAYMDAWDRAAGVHIRILSKPQLFIEGNHRCSALMISYVLGQAGLPPFVLTPENAGDFFEPSPLITDTSKASLSMLFRMRPVRKRFARFLKAESHPELLLPSPHR